MEGKSNFQGKNIFHPFNFAVVFCQSFASFPFLKFQWTENVTFTAVPSAYLICIIFCGLGEVKICHHLKALKGVMFRWGGYVPQYSSLCIAFEFQELCLFSSFITRGWARTSPPECISLDRWLKNSKLIFEGQGGGSHCLPSCNQLAPES